MMKTMKRMNGIDISNWQKNLNLEKINFDFVIVKATEGLHFVDPYCNRFITQAEKLGKPWGFYHFAHPENDPIREARFFYENTRNYFGRGVPVLDWEMQPLGNTNWALTWLKEVEKLSGVKPMIYMSEYVVNLYDWSEVVKNNNGLWVAKYRDNSPDYNYDMMNAGPAPRVKFWPGYAVWQWTGTGRLDGYSGNLDLDIFYGDVEAWNKYAGKSIKKKYYVKMGPFETREEAETLGGEILEE